MNPHDKINEHFLDAMDYLTRGINRQILDILYEDGDLAPKIIMERLGDSLSNSSTQGFTNRLSSLREAGWLVFDQTEKKIESVRLSKFGQIMLQSIYVNQTILEESFL